MFLGNTFNVSNNGLGGTTAMDQLPKHRGNANVPYLEHALKYPHLDFRNFNPDYAFIMFGTNDAHIGNWNYEKFKESYKNMI